MTTYKIKISNGLEYTDYKDLAAAKIASKAILAEPKNKYQKATIFEQFTLNDFYSAAQKSNLCLTGTDRSGIIVSVNGFEIQQKRNSSAGFIGESIIEYLFKKSPKKDKKNKISRHNFVEKTINTAEIIESLKFLQNPTGTEDLIHEVEAFDDYGHCPEVCHYLESVITYIYDRAE
jgi:hypothetical protein